MPRRAPVALPSRHAAHDSGNQARRGARRGCDFGQGVDGRYPLSAARIRSTRNANGNSRKWTLHGNPQDSALPRRRRSDLGAQMRDLEKQCARCGDIQLTDRAARSGRVAGRALTRDNALLSVAIPPLAVLRAGARRSGSTCARKRQRLAARAALAGLVDVRFGSLADRKPHRHVFQI